MKLIENSRILNNPFSQVEKGNFHETKMNLEILYSYLVIKMSSVSKEILVKLRRSQFSTHIYMVYVQEKGNINENCSCCVLANHN